MSESQLDRARAMRSSGRELEEVLALLRFEGVSIIESIKIVREVEGVSLGDAKTQVHGSETWADRREESERLHDIAMSSLDDIDPSRPT